MELTAPLEALRTLGQQLQVVTDSTYVANCFRDKWHVGWMRRGWKNSQGKPVANRDLWEPLIELVLATGTTFRWVKGHSGNVLNDFVDQIAVEAARTQKAASGDGAPMLTSV